MPSKSQCTMYLVNTALLALGLALTAVAAAVLTHHKELLDNVPDSDAFVHSALKNGPATALATGVILFLMGCMGCYAARNFEKGLAKCVLFVYSFLAFVLFVVALVAGVIELHMSGMLRNYEDPGSKQAHAFDQKIYQAMSKFSNTTFDKCCVDGQLSSSEECSVLKGMVNQDQYADACMDKATFQTDFFAWLSHALKPLGTVSVIVGVAAFMLLVASCCLLWRTRKQEAAARKPLRDAEAGQGGYYAQAQYQPPSSTAGRLT